ncbi:hypothetical protein Tco_0450414 [Tanacetum coccineum]
MAKIQEVLTADLGSDVEPLSKVKEQTDKEVVEDFRIKLLGNVSFDELYRNDETRGTDESSFDTESEITRKEITLIGSSRDTKIQEADSDLESMSDDEFKSVFRFEVDDDDEDDHSKHKAKLSKTNKAVVDDVIDLLVDMANSKDANLNTSVDKLSKWLIKLRMVVDALEERVCELLSDTLKTILPGLLKDSVKKAMPKMESWRFVILQKKLGKAIKKTMGKSVQRNVKKEIRAVPKDIMVVNAKQLQTKIEKNASDILKLVDLIRELVRLIDRVPSSGKSATMEVDINKKTKKPSQNDKTEHGMEKAVQNKGQSPKMPKSESILKNTIECNLNPSDGPGKPNSIFMKTVKTKWALNQFQQPICVQLTKTVKTLKAQS